MNFLDLAKKRYSVRSYTHKKVEKDKRDLILEAARVAPTGVNFQPFRILVVESEEGLKKVAKGARTFSAPLIFIMCANESEAWHRKYDNKSIEDIDTSIATDHMMMEATDLGLGSLWICYFEPEVIKREFDIPDYLEPVNILAVGYTDKEPKSPDRHDEERKDIDDFVFYEEF